MENNHITGLDQSSGLSDSNNDHPQVEGISENIHICIIEHKKYTPTRIPNFKNLAKFRDAKFRNSSFYFKNSSAIKKLFLNTSKDCLITYKGLCDLIRRYIINKNLLTQDGLIICDDFLKNVCKTNMISFFELATHFTSIIL
jgi:hypothetical protein